GAGVQIDDAPAATLEHAGDHGPCQEEGPVDVGLQQLRELGRIRLPQRHLGVDQAGIVHQQVDRAELLTGRGHGSFHRLHIGDVRCQRDRTPSGGPDLLGHRLQARGAARQPCHVQAGLGQMAGNGCADTAGGAGDQSGAGWGRGGAGKSAHSTSLPHCPVTECTCPSPPPLAQHTTTPTTTTPPGTHQRQTRNQHTPVSNRLRHTAGHANSPQNLELTKQRRGKAVRGVSAGARRAVQAARRPASVVRAPQQPAAAPGRGPRPPRQDFTEVCCWAPSGSPSPVPPSPPSSSTRPSPRSLEITTGPIAIRPATTAMAIRSTWFASAGTLIATTAGAISTETRFITLISGLIAGPAVSLNGSPM